MPIRRQICGLLETGNVKARVLIARVGIIKPRSDCTAQAVSAFVAGFSIRWTTAGVFLLAHKSTSINAVKPAGFVWLYACRGDSVC